MTGGRFADPPAGLATRRERSLEPLSDYLAALARQAYQRREARSRIEP